MRLTANARLLGSSQWDALQNITGTFAAGSATGFPASTLTTGAFVAGQGGTLGNMLGTQTGSTRYLGFNASSVARTSSETRGANVALAPRLYV
ncbi:hypothetical protein ACFOEY_20190 [Paracandidimonas soli]|uniref:hypothetical protein n=1 Tax=Paracandidimonas soli TaxID=1917182 RepID=UPI0036226415